MKIKPGVDFDDVMIMPRVGKYNITSRSQPNLYTKNGNYPIYSSPMLGVSDAEMVIKLGRLNCVGILHRFFYNTTELIRELEKIQQAQQVNPFNWGLSIGLSYNDMDLLILLGYLPDIICVDVANGYNPNVYKTVGKLSKLISDNCYEIDIMAGSVATYDGALKLAEYGANIIRVGVGSGSVCTTRNVTGIGVPQLTAIEDCAQIKVDYPYVEIVADGGIRNSGDAVKAFCVGADGVMLGKLLAQTQTDKIVVTYSGMASKELHEAMNKNVQSIEGMSMKLTADKPIDEFINEFLGGIRSACTYLGARNIYDLQDVADFISTGKNSLKSV